MNHISQTNRFLTQATLGFDWKLLNEVQKQGEKAWLKEQLSSSPSRQGLFEQSTRNIWQDFKARLISRHGSEAIDGDGNNPALPYKWYFRMAWWNHTLTDRTDLLRQRIALALSEILVISDNSSLELNAIGMASYYDLLYKHAFGNYTDLLYEVSLHPTMGVYLSHMNNRKAAPDKHIHPDENYAREIMQLFSIGLFELNNDGSEKLNSAGQPIATYNYQDIKELARVFTGLRAHSYHYEWSNSFWDEDYNGYAVDFEDDVEKQYKTIPFVEMTKPMIFDEKYHDRCAKSILKGKINLAGNQDGEDEVRTMVRQLVKHPNTAPFIARHMINKLVTSNPSLEYINAVASSFGKNGDLKSMIWTLLTYPMEHNVSSMKLPSSYVDNDHEVQSQKLKSPLQRSIQTLLAFGAHNNSNKLWLIGDDMQETILQHPLSSPTVFNFYKPDFSPHGKIEKSGLVAPEFELHTSSTSIGYINQMYHWIVGGFLPLVSTKIGSTDENKIIMEMDPNILWDAEQDKLRLNLNSEIEIASDPKRHSELVDRIGMLLTGRKTLSIKPQILRDIASYKNQPEWVVKTIIFLISISPEFAIQEA